MNKRKSYACSYCNKEGHNKRTCRLRKTDNRHHSYKPPNQQKCSQCGLIGHDHLTCDYGIEIQKAQTIQLEKWLKSKTKSVKKN